jgi:hypothetical protein
MERDSVMEKEWVMDSVMGKAKALEWALVS